VGCNLHGFTSKQFILLVNVVTRQDVGNLTAKQSSLLGIGNLSLDQVGDAFQPCVVLQDHSAVQEETG
jgi:hypothetical protein